MKFLAFLTAISLALILFGPSPDVPQTGAAVKPAPQDKPMTEKMMQDMFMKYGMPGKAHEFLKKFVGSWDMEVKSWMKPGDPPATSAGTQTNQLIFGGRYVEIKLEIVMGTMKLTGMEILGYDLFENKYTNFYIDDSTTAFTVVTGGLDPSGMALTQTGMSPDIMTGKMQKIRAVTTFLAEGKYRFEIFMVQPDGKDFKSLEFLAVKKTT